MKKADQLLSSLRPSLYFITVMWVIQLFQFLTGTKLGFLGIYPRHIDGLKGIFFSPLVHSSSGFSHILNNSFPFIVSMTIIFLVYRKVAVKSIAFIYVLTGLFVWLFGRDVFHIGASGVVYGMVSFIFWNGIFRFNIRSIAVALIIVLLYSGMIVGLFPSQPGISWESHLIGAVVGMAVSFMLRNQIEEVRKPMEPEIVADERPFFASNTFD